MGEKRPSSQEVKNSSLTLKGNAGERRCTSKTPSLDRKEFIYRGGVLLIRGKGGWRTKGLLEKGPEPAAQGRKSSLRQAHHNLKLLRLSVEKVTTTSLRKGIPPLQEKRLPIRGGEET